MSHTSLISIIIENKLNGDNFGEWKQNLLIVIICEKHKVVLDETCPLEAQAKDLLGCQVALARQSYIKKLMNSQQKSNTPVKEHMLRLMGFFAKVEENGAKLDMNIQIEIELKSLTKEFASFKVTYNLGNNALTLT
ncbi:hypothetical protein Gotur_033966 [Gossypium turneri]